MSLRIMFSVRETSSRMQPYVPVKPNYSTRFAAWVKLAPRSPQNWANHIHGDG